MSNRFVVVGSCVVIGVQLVAPLVLGVPQMLKKDAPLRRRRGRAGAKAAAADDAAVDRLAPLACPNCHAPVPLAGRSFPCPSCGAEVVPPADYAVALVKHAEAERVLARAERVWRWSRFSSAFITVWLARLAMVAWSLAVIAAAVFVDDVGWPSPVAFLAGILALVQLLVGLALVSVFADMKKTLPPLPKRRALAIDAGAGACRGCGAPVAFAAGRLAVTCGYCSAVTYRAALARAGRETAERGDAEARTSLLDAVGALDKRRNEVTLFLGFLAIAEIFYAVVLALGSAYDLVLG